MRVLSEPSSSASSSSIALSGVRGASCLSLLLVLAVTGGSLVRLAGSSGEVIQSSHPEAGIPSASLSAADGRFRYEGRFDFTNPAAPVVIWQASRIRLDFSGRRISLHFDHATGQNYFNTEIDASNTIISVTEGQPEQTVTVTNLGAGRHHLVLFKRSEAAAGTVRFRGVTLAPNARAWTPKKPDYKLKMEFIGDSITVGACNEDGPEDQWTNRVTHNAALSYPELVADAFHADYRNIAVSGMGIATGWVEIKAGEIWDRLYPNTNSPRANLSKWTPDVVFVNFGENDDSYPRAHKLPFPTGYTAGYVKLIHDIRSAYPRAEIVILRGGMFGGAKSDVLRAAWEPAVAEIEASDPRVHHFVFTRWTGTHPRVPDDRAMADELIAWLQGQGFMREHK